MVSAPLDWKMKARQDCEAAVPLFAETLPAWVRREVADGRARGIDGERWSARAASPRARRSRRSRHGSWDVRRPRRRCRGCAAASRRASPTSVRPAVRATVAARTAGAARPLGDDAPAPLLDEAQTALAMTRAPRSTTMAAPYGGWPAVQEQLAEAHPPPPQYLARFREKWDACRAAAEAHDLVTWPDAPLRYVPFPEHTRDAAPKLYYLHYRSPAPFDPFGTFDYVVAPLDGLTGDEITARLRQWNDSVITLNHVVHHGAIGHHVQNHHAYRGASRIGRVAAVDAACRISMFLGGSLAEGWACYVCDLMEEVGFLTPLEAIAQQHTRVRIAARAVADLQLHTGRATFRPSPGTTKTRRMSRLPPAARPSATACIRGAAVMYWLGTRGIHRLRAEVRRREGAAFSMRRFHDRFALVRRHPGGPHLEADAGRGGPLMRRDCITGVRPLWVGAD
jgi:hypothetical protein